MYLEIIEEYIELFRRCSKLFADIVDSFRQLGKYLELIRIM
jgi:hypothetical protein